MIQIISFDMDGTLIESEYTDWVWHHGIPSLYAEKAGLPFEEAKDFVMREYGKVGEAAIEWYDIKYWFRLFELGMGWKALMERYADKISVYPDVQPISGSLEGISSDWFSLPTRGENLSMSKWRPQALRAILTRSSRQPQTSGKSKRPPVSTDGSVRCWRSIRKRWSMWGITMSLTTSFRGL